MVCRLVADSLIVVDKLGNCFSAFNVFIPDSRYLSRFHQLCMYVYLVPNML
jgi:hypothetical protein